MLDVCENCVSFFYWKKKGKNRVLTKIIGGFPLVEGGGLHLDKLISGIHLSLNLYPKLRTVSIFDPKSPSFFRNPSICTSIDRSVTG